MNISDLQKRVLAGKLSPDLLSDLVAYWDMDGNGVDSVSGISPILETDITYNNASILGTSAETTASNSILRYADDDRFSFTDAVSDLPFSISFWVYFTAFSSTGNWLIMKRSFAGGHEWQVRYGTSSTSIGLFKNSLASGTVFQNCETNQNLFSLNTWYHIVFTDNGTADFNGMNVYVNGLNQNGIRNNTGGTYTKMSNTTQTLGMMNANWSPQGPLRHQGRLDEVAIWKGRELTPQEVLFLYNNGNGITYIDL
jgi:hypothetical protein